MQDRHLYEYAVIRLVPRVEREEFINIGVVLYCKQEEYLKVRIELNEDRAKALCSTIDLSEIRLYLTAFEKIANGEVDSGLIATYDIASRFRWLTAKRSTVVQLSAIHVGLTGNADITLHKLFSEIVV
jgi:hypothetical protein